MTIEDTATLTVTDFRAISGTVSIPVHADITLVHGSNGMGKSSLVSALELALAGTVSGIGADASGHLLHHGRPRGRVTLDTAGDSRTSTINQVVTANPHLVPGDAAFLSDRCYLPQSKLGRLLEIYQASASKKQASPLTRFVQELLGLDEIEAILDGLEPVMEVARLRTFVPEFEELEREPERLTPHLDAGQAQRSALRARLAAERQGVAASLSALEAPETLRIDAAGAVEVGNWVRSQDGSAELSALVGYQHEVRSMSERFARWDASGGASSLRVATSRLREAKAALSVWDADAGRKVEGALTALQKELTAVPSAVSMGPGPAVEEAIRLLRIETARCRTLLERDGEAREALEVATERLASEKKQVAATEARLSAMATTARFDQLVQLLTSAADLIEGDVCPVCERDYAEVRSGTELRARLRARLTNLTAQAKDIQALTALRRTHMETVAQLERAVADSEARRLSAADRSAAAQRLSGLEQSASELGGLADSAAQGDSYVRRVTAAEQEVSQLSGEAETVSSLSARAADLARAVGLPSAGGDLAIREVIPRIAQVVASKLASAERRQAARHDALAALEAFERDRQSLIAVDREVHDIEARIERATSEFATLKARREALKRVRRTAEAKKVDVISTVFTEGLNRTWRSLFVRLAPDEPYVPSFRVPPKGRKLAQIELETVHRDGSPAGAPGAMLSSGNLNTAALTLFLALNLSVPRRLPWLLLDDPIQSMDEVHVSQFAALIRSLVRDHGRQVVLAVHERSLFDYLSLELAPARRGATLSTVSLSRDQARRSVVSTVNHVFIPEPALASV